MNPIIPWVAGGLFVAFAGWQYKLIRDTRKTPMQHYTVEQSADAFEIRVYEPFLKASVLEQGSYSEISYKSFQRLAGYIFGGNEAREQIAMTTPVSMKYTDTTHKQAEFSFVMPKADVSKPLDASVKMEQVPGFRAASIRFGGVAGEDTFREKEAELKTWLDARKIRYIAQAEWLRYNPPFQLLGRRNEVLLRLQ